METLKEIPEERECSNCGDILPLATGFYDDKRAKGGKSRRCIKCSDANTMENAKRRQTGAMSPRAEATKKLYAARFRVIRKAGLSVDVEGLAVQNKIDRELKKHGLYRGIRGIPIKKIPVRFIRAGVK